MVIIDQNDKNIIDVNEERFTVRFYTSKSPDIGSKKVRIFCEIYFNNDKEDFQLAEYANEKEAEAVMRKVAELLMEKTQTVDFGILR